MRKNWFPVLFLSLPCTGPNQKEQNKVSVKLLLLQLSSAISKSRLLKYSLIMKRIDEATVISVT